MKRNRRISILFSPLSLCTLSLLNFCNPDWQNLKDPNLQLLGLKLTPGKIEPAFSPERFNYTLRVPPAGRYIGIRPTLKNPANRVSIRNIDAKPGEMHDLGILRAGDRIPIKITNPAGEFFVYSLLVLPEDFPHFKIRQLQNPAPGYIFLANYDKSDMEKPNPITGRYLIILDQYIVPVWFYKSASALGDFRPESQKLFSFYHWNEKSYYTISYDQKSIQKYSVSGQYDKTDNHDFILNPNGSYYLTALVDQPFTAPGQPKGKTSTAEFVILKYSKERKLLFEWKSWEHFPVSEYIPEIRNTEIKNGKIDYAHFNSLAVDGDGNLLISRKHLSEVTKIDGKSGKLIWRLGGRHGQFRFEGDPFGSFNHQHCVRMTPEGNILLYDNGKLHRPPQSRATEYQLNTAGKLAKLTWSFYYPGLYTEIMGSVQRLSNGSTFVGWGGPVSDIAFTEISKAGKVTTEVSLPAGQTSYRIQKFEWTPPYLRE